MAARSSLLRRPPPGARPARPPSSVVAAPAALAPRLVRLAHHGYPDRLLGGGDGSLGIDHHRDAVLDRRHRHGRDHPRAAAETSGTRRRGAGRALDAWAEDW